MIQEEDVLTRATGPPFLSTLHARTTQQTLLAINLASQQKKNKALLFFSGKETVQTFSGSI